VSFTWGKPEHEPQSGEVTIFEPPRRIRYQWRERTGYLEFVLEPLPDGTRLSFIDHFEADFRQDQSRVDPSDKAASLPAGPDTPWRPGFVAGFHLNLAALGQFVCEDWSAEQIRVRSQRGCDIANGKLEGSFESGPDSDWSELVEVYYEHIQKSCPAATE
jgi:hypothetical protein